MHARNSELLRTAAAAGLDPIPLDGDSGGLLVTCRGARMLGIFLRDTQENLLWVSAALRSSESARAFLAAGEWNLGGDRCWLSPELELHFRNAQAPSHENYFVPAAVDPGNYICTRQSDSAVILAAEGEVANLLHGAPFRFTTARTISLAPPPVATEGVSYVGYVLSSDLRIVTPDRDDAQYGLWQLMQVPTGGRIFIPVRRPPELVDYFQTNVARHCTVVPGHVEFPVTGTEKQKLGLRSVDTGGTMGYYRITSAGVATLIVRQAVSFAGATHADYPAHQPTRRDIALQFYNDASGPESFGEMEYHSPAARTANLFQVRDVSRTWCYAGTPERVQAVGRELLGVDLH